VRKVLDCLALMTTLTTSRSSISRTKTLTTWLQLALIGTTDQANHQYDLQDFYCTGCRPAACGAGYLRRVANDGHQATPIRWMNRILG
jgi:hypothetical protein